jgi:hypothetical protein
MTDAMTQVSVDRVVAASPERLYELISDVSRMGEWSPETAVCAWTGGATGPAVGAKFKGTNRNGKKKWSTTCTVVVADPGRAFAFEVSSGPLKVARWEYAFQPEGDGCRVVETWTDRRGVIVKLGGKPVSGVADRGAHNRATMEQTLERLASAATAASA